jgi:hypothetical protein
MIAFGFTLVFLTSIFFAVGGIVQNNNAYVGVSQTHDPVMRSASTTSQGTYSCKDITVPKITGWGWEYFCASVYYHYTYTERINRTRNPGIFYYTFLNFLQPLVSSNSQYVTAHVSSFNGFAGLETIVTYYGYFPGYGLIESITQQLALSGTMQMSGLFIQSFNANLIVYSDADSTYSFVTGTYAYSHTVNLPSTGLSVPIVLDS